MPISGTIQKLAQEKGLTPRELCQRAFNEFGSEIKAAWSLGVYPNTIRHHLGKNKPPAKKGSKTS